MIIDPHAHISPVSWIEEVRAGRFGPGISIEPGDKWEMLVTKSTVLGKERIHHNPLPRETYDVELRLSHMEQMGVEKQILSVALLLLAYFVRGAPPLLFFAAVVFAGFGYGLIRPTVSTLLADNFQGKRLGVISGAAMTIFSLSGVFSPYLTGALFDASGSYRAGFLLIFAVVAAGGGCIAALGGIMRREGGIR